MRDSYLARKELAEIELVELTEGEQKPLKVTALYRLDQLLARPKGAKIMVYMLKGMKRPLVTVGSRDVLIFKRGTEVPLGDFLQLIDRAYDKTHHELVAENACVKGILSVYTMNWVRVKKFRGGDYNEHC